MSKAMCCVVDYSNSRRNSEYFFFKFPLSESKREQRRLWIAVVKRKNVDGSPWMPKPHDCICSAHFFGNDKSDDPWSPSYLPTIFPLVHRTKKINSQAAARRFKRLKDKSHTNVLKLATLCDQGSHPNVEIQADIIINWKVTNDRGVGTVSSEPVQSEVELGLKGMQPISQEK
ncbi:hypothetical protein QAD02_013244 [Eretmocerus hayati]|uniref:Uncharacterized protein n=1 Tax=Eretmocerus hayati TaxID=131215 RepID=A0ACC2P4U5_9HYME|nr:hypothetical protein QAD02_013244 [Eretmocerus hayati]